MINIVDFLNENIPNIKFTVDYDKDALYANEVYLGHFKTLEEDINCGVQRRSAQKEVIRAVKTILSYTQNLTNNL